MTNNKLFSSPTKVINTIDDRGVAHQVEALASFWRCVRGVKLRFIVVRKPGESNAAVVHRDSLRHVCGLPEHSASISASDWIVAGRRSVENLIKKYSEVHILYVLSVMYVAYL